MRTTTLHGSTLKLSFSVSWSFLICAKHPILILLFNSEGIAGHQFHDDYHPRLAALLIGAGQVLVLIFWPNIQDLCVELQAFYCASREPSRTSLLALPCFNSWDIYYWTLLAVADILDCLFRTIFEASRRSYTTQKFMWALFRHTVFRIVSFSTLKAITRAKFRLSKRWIPTVHFSPASHAERTSQRLDSRTSWRFNSPVSLFRWLSDIFLLWQYSSPGF